MNESLKDKIVLGARRLIRKAPCLRGVITFGLVFVLFVYHIFHSLTSNTKKLVSLAMLVVFYTISCSFCAPMFQLEEEGFVQEVDTEHLEGEDIVLAEESTKVEKPEGVSVEEEIAENPEAEADEDVDNYSSDEILAQYEAGLPGTGKMETDADVSADDWALLLVNNRHPIPEGYEFTLGTIMGSLQCDERIIPDLLEMLQGAKSDGISLEICSPYRTDERQVILFNRKVKKYMKKGMSYMDAYKKSAQVVNVPGTSEHQIGLALDIYTGSYRKLDEGFGKTKEGIWLKEHCSEYGFILRYPKGKEYITGIEYEAWHFRYVGKEAAKAIMEQDITLEEYVEQLGSGNP